LLSINRFEEYIRRQREDNCFQSVQNSYPEESIYKNNIPGFIQKGTYSQNGIEIEFINTGFSKGLIM
jgi:hypothetical protein